MQFFLVITPGLEDIAERELRKKFSSVTILEKTYGGILIEAELSLALSLNTWLKIPTRILLRLQSFTCRDFSKLFLKAQKIPWNDYLLGGQAEFKVEAAKSRLNNEKRIEEVCKEALSKYVKAQEPKKVFTPYTHKIFVRMYEDVCTLSLDTSGEALYKRGYRVEASPANLRETLACSLLTYLFEGLPDETYHLVDPMCGSGTIAQEASVYHLANTARVYAASFIACLQKNPPSLMPLDEKPLPLSQITAQDRDAEILNSARTNSIALEATYSPLIKVKYAHVNLFEIEPKPAENYLVCLNPPYGKKIEMSEDPATFYQHILEDLERVYKAKRVAMVVPGEYLKFVPKNRIVKTMKTTHGGLPIYFVVTR